MRRLVLLPVLVLSLAGFGESAQVRDLRDIGLLRVRETAYLAPAMLRATIAVLADMRAAGHPAKVVETIRLDALQRHYFSVGVTQLPSAWRGWHAYGLAVDIVHETKEWNAEPAFWRALERIAEKHGLTSGRDWDRNNATTHSFIDAPHVQWGQCRVSPSDRARVLLARGGVFAVWQEVGAL